MLSELRSVYRIPGSQRERCMFPTSFGNVGKSKSLFVVCWNKFKNQGQVDTHSVCFGKHILMVYELMCMAPSSGAGDCPNSCRVSFWEEWLMRSPNPIGPLNENWYSVIQTDHMNEAPSRPIGLFAVGSQLQFAVHIFCVKWSFITWC